MCVFKSVKTFNTFILFSSTENSGEIDWGDGRAIWRNRRRQNENIRLSFVKGNKFEIASKVHNIKFNVERLLIILWAKIILR